MESGKNNTFSAFITDGFGQPPPTGKEPEKRFNQSFSSFPYCKTAFPVFSGIPLFSPPDIVMIPANRSGHLHPKSMSFFMNTIHSDFYQAVSQLNIQGLARLNR